MLLTQHPHNFNSRSHAGSDSRMILTGSSFRIFQFTLPRGERPHKAHKALSIGIISIHAPTRGATKAPDCPSAHPCYFNSRSHAGSDGMGEHFEVYLKEFQFTLPRGERPYIHCMKCNMNQVNLQMDSLQRYFHRYKLQKSIHRRCEPLRTMEAADGSHLNYEHAF